MPPKTASVVTQPRHEWSKSDAQWLERARGGRAAVRSDVDLEVHLGSWRLNSLEDNRPLTYLELADELSAYVRDMGFTHIELLPVMHHPFSGSWGYQVTGYFAPTPRHGTPDELREFIDRMHADGIGVILDWVPAHFPRDEFALARFDGTALYEHADPRRGAHPDWGTLVFNFGRHEVRNFLLANALFWLREYHVDGIRVDAVASMLYLDYSRRAGEWIPNEFGGREDLEAVAFLKELNEVMYGHEPGIVSAAEESTAWPGVSRPTYLGGLGFGFKWNMGWMHDTLGYFQQDPIYRRYHHHELTFSLMYAFSENFILPLSHDEVVHGKGSLLNKMPGDRWQKLANLRTLYAYMWAHPGKKLLFMGGELAQESEWSHERSLDWHLLEDPEHAGIQRAGPRSQPPLPRRAGAVGGRLRSRRGSGGSSPTTLIATWSRSPGSRRSGGGWSCSSPTCPRCRGRATASACRARPLARGAEHRLDVLRRRRHRQPRRGRGRADPLARAAGLGRADAAAAGGDLARAGVNRPVAGGAESPRVPRHLPGSALGARPLDDGATPSSASGLPGAERAVELELGGAAAPMDDAGLGVYELIAPVRARATTTGSCSTASRCPIPCSRWQPGGPARPVAGPGRQSRRRARAPAMPALDELVIYELHVGTFSAAGTFAGAIPHLPSSRSSASTRSSSCRSPSSPALADGATTASTSPPPSPPMAARRGSASSSRAAHAAGLAVILDVVYNHVGASGVTALEAFGPYFTEKYETPWGRAINYDDAGCDAVREWVLQSAGGWVADFGIDGLRLDAIHAIFDSLARAHRRGGGAPSARGPRRTRSSSPSPG